jgi:hypothetical protein
MYAAGTVGKIEAEAAKDRLMVKDVLGCLDAVGLDWSKFWTLRACLFATQLGSWLHSLVLLLSNIFIIRLVSHSSIPSIFPSILWQLDFRI